MLCKKNYNSPKLPTNTQIMKEIEGGHYILCTRMPTIVLVLGVIPKGSTDKVRLIHDCFRLIDKALNDYATPSKLSFHSLNGMVKTMKHGNEWMAKLDI